MSLNSTDPKQVRKFGLTALILFGCLCGLALFRRKLLPTYIFAFLSVLGLGFVLSPKLLAPVYSAWLRAAYIVGRLSTALILTLTYYLVLTPTALLKRAFGGSPVPVKPDEKLSSYWVARSEPSQPKIRFIKRY